MRKLYTLLMVLLLANNCLGQKIRYTDTSNVWTLTFDIWDDAPGPAYPSVLFYTGDTVLNGLTYQKQNGPYCVREDTNTGKVFFFDLEDGSEKLLFDYHLSIGDTMLSYGSVYSSFNIPDTFFLVSTDSILIGNVAHLIQDFEHVGSGVLVRVIEGLGCYEGARFLQAPHVNPAFLITCFRNQGNYPSIDPIQHFVFDNVNSCNILSVDPVPGNDLKVRIFPNPVNRYSSIYFDKQIGSGSLMIRDILGRKIAERPIKDASFISLEDIDMSSGVYYYTIIDASEQWSFSGKLLFD